MRFRQVRVTVCVRCVCVGIDSVRIYMCAADYAQCSAMLVDSGWYLLPERHNHEYKPLKHRIPICDRKYPLHLHPTVHFGRDNGEYLFFSLPLSHTPFF